MLKSPEYQGLPRHEQGELLGMLRGFVETLHALQQIQWCFWVDGAYMSANEYRQTGRPYSELDDSKSAHVWKGTDKPWSRTPTPS